MEEQITRRAFVGTYADLREMTGATVLDGPAIRGEEVAGSLDQVDAWYAGLGL